MINRLQGLWPTMGLCILKWSIWLKSNIVQHSLIDETVKKKVFERNHIPTNFMSSTDVLTQINAVIAN